MAFHGLRSGCNWCLICAVQALIACIHYDRSLATMRIDRHWPSTRGLYHSSFWDHHSRCKTRTYKWLTFQVMLPRNKWVYKLTQLRSLPCIYMVPSQARWPTQGHRSINRVQLWLEATFQCGASKSRQRETPQRQLPAL